ncbi:AUX/IAA protein [Dioscorea alata]|uniref:AUX/IAA protein n=1 Tax=Dioscorea alata TaxID=55571 RepID=A0ACB7V8H3_DIOAL|nr:AUX/IAA protein [Dioscorea alata]
MRAEPCGSSGSMSSVSKGAGEAEDFVGLLEVTSVAVAVEDEELELGLSLGAKNVNGGGGGKCCRILTAQEFTALGSRASPRSSSSSVSSSSGAANGVAGTKKDSDAVGSASNPPSQMVVGWPPIRAFRMNNLGNQSKYNNDAHKQSINEENTVCKDLDQKAPSSGSSSFFVKVNMDGDPIGRKVDLNAHVSYESLALALELMFNKSNTPLRPHVYGMKASKLLDGSCDFALTYEDKDGDWMLVGDVPWGMFLSTVKRLRIMRTADADGLAPRIQSSNRAGGLIRS